MLGGHFDSWQASSLLEIRVGEVKIDCSSMSGGGAAQQYLFSCVFVLLAAEGTMGGRRVFQE